jgi:hypothetical protein
MRRLLKVFPDPKLARKISILRTVFLLLGLCVVALLVVVASGGKLVARGSATGGRFVSDGYLSTVSWSESPSVYLLLLLWYVVLSLAFLGGLYIALARLMEKRHGRRPRFFQRKYPY